MSSKKEVRWTLCTMVVLFATMLAVTQSFAAYDGGSRPGVVCKKKMIIKDGRTDKTIPVTEANVVVAFNNNLINQMVGGCPALNTSGCVDLGVIDRGSVISVAFKEDLDPAKPADLLATIKLLDGGSMDDETDLEMSGFKPVADGKYQARIQWFVRGWLIDGVKKRQVVITELELKDI